MSSQTTSGIHRLGKFYKPGQLVTIDRHVYRITKVSEPPTCEHCVNRNRKTVQFVGIIIAIYICFAINYN